MLQRIVTCPQCGANAVWETNNRYRPFCSERCKTADLSQWAQESYRIPDTDIEIDLETQNNIERE